MKRVVNLLGSALVVAGLALLLYTGIAYEQRSNSAPTARSWSATQRHQAANLARKLTARQVVLVPNALRTSARVGPGREPAARIVIPKINVNSPVVQTAPVQGVWEVADWSVGHLTTTPDPGAPGNAAYSAHDDIKGEIFKRLGQLQPGDEIRLVTAHSVYIYVVTNQVVVDPSNISVLNPTKASTVTLISCTPYWVDTQRLVIQGTLKSRVSV